MASDSIVKIAACVVPLSVILWLGCLSFCFFRAEQIHFSPLRCLVSLLAPVFIAKWGLERGSLDKSGAIAGFIVGFVLTFSNFCFFSSLLAFFVLGSKVTKFRSQQKKKFEEDFKEGGQRNWIQVLCNGGMAAEFAILYLMDMSSRKSPAINFQDNYNSSWYCLATVGALCCSCGDTLSSEIGSVIGKSNPRLITNLQKVPRGTNGGVSLAGCIASIIGGACVCLAYFLTLILMISEEELKNAPPQWILIPVGGILGLMGSMIDSLLGATMQFSGLDLKTGHVVSQPGTGVEHIAGSYILDNHGVNVLAALITGFLSPKVALVTWQYFL